MNNTVFSQRLVKLISSSPDDLTGDQLREVLLVPKSRRDSIRIEQGWIYYKFSIKGESQTVFKHLCKSLKHANQWAFKNGCILIE